MIGMLAGTRVVYVVVYDWAHYVAQPLDVFAVWHGGLSFHGAVAWAMVFPTDPLHVPHHPSQLYEAICEGIVLFIVLRWLERCAVRDRWYRPGLLAGVFLAGYGVLRFAIEFTREPDAQLGLVLGPFSMGQLLCVAMVAAGALVLARVYRPSVATSA